MSEPSKAVPIEDKYKGQSTEDFLMADDPVDTPAKPEKEIELVEPKIKEPAPEDILEGTEEPATGETEPEEPEEPEIEDKGDEPIFPVPKKVILAKYPNLFKEFKFLERAMYRDKEFTELVGTPEDAKELVEAKQRLDNIQTDVLSGKIDDILSEVKQVDANAFARLVDNYLPALQKVDQVAYLTVISNIGKLIISDMYNTAKRSSNAEQEAAAIVLHQYLFPNMDYQPPQRLAKEEPKPDERQVQAQAQWAQQQHNGAISALVSRIDNTLKATIEAHIDPNSQMSAYEKRGAIQDTLSAIHEKLSEDTYFRPYHDRLWKQAIDSGYDPKKLELIQKNYLSRSRTMLRDTMAKVRGQVLKGKKGPNADKDKQGPIRPGRTASGQERIGSTQQSVTEKAKAIPKNMTTLDYLNQE